MPKMQNSKQKATTTILPHVEKYTFRGEDCDTNIATQSLNKKDTIHMDDDEEVSSILCIYTNKQTNKHTNSL